MNGHADVDGHDAEVDYLEVCVADVNGIRHSRTYRKKHIASIVKHGFGLCEALPFLPCHADVIPPESKFGASREFCVMPDMTTFRRLPWRKSAGVVIGNLHTESGDVSPDCSRQVLRETLWKLKEEYGYNIKIGFETEFFLFKKGVEGDACFTPLSEQFYESQNDTVVHAKVLEEIAQTLDKMNIDVIAFHPESSCGQFEIVTSHTDPLKACDNLLLTRLAIVAVAHRNGLDASFLPKIFADSNGSGCHIHMSIEKDRVDVLQGPTPKALTAEGQHFINGLLKHQAAWMIFATGTSNSFRRYQLGCASSVFTVWGVNNREAMIRVLFPMKGVENSIHFEQKCFDATTNPHVGVAALVVAGILGLREKKLLPPKTQVDPASLSDAELEKKEAKRYPTSVSEAISGFHADAAFKSLFTTVSSEDFVTATLACRKASAEHFAPLGVEAEIEYLYKRY